MSNASTSHLARLPSSSGLVSYLALSRLRWVNSPVSAMIRPPGLSASRLVLSAAGFIATSTSGASPAVSIWVEPKLIWNAETPNSVPCGARISAGKVGESGEIVAGERGRQGELPAGQLHAVAAVAREADDDRFGSLCIGRSFGRLGCHRSVLPARRARSYHNAYMGPRPRFPPPVPQSSFSVAQSMHRMELPTMNALSRPA